MASHPVLFVELKFSGLTKIFAEKLASTNLSLALIDDTGIILWSQKDKDSITRSFNNFSNLDDCQFEATCEMKMVTQVYDFPWKNRNRPTQPIFFFMHSEITKPVSTDVSNIYSFIVTNSTYLDFLAFIIVAVIVWGINLKLVSKAYYMIFSQVNLFNHKLEQYTESMLKPSELPKFSIDDLLFPEASEISDFFIEFFEMFNKNSIDKNNSFDMTDSVEKITSQLKKTRVFRKKFDETVADSIYKLVHSRHH